ncbi:MAG: polyprenyl synthetase family protein [Vicinamibacteria bacterium]
MLDFDRYLSELAAAVDDFLDRNLPAEDAYPPSIHRAIRYSLFAGGKRLRPVLTLAAAEAVGGRREDALPAAAAMEMIHTYSLIHDDLPAMDNDDLRRGKPTSHVVFGEAIAILAGDALLTHAFHILATVCVSSDRANGAPYARRLRAVGTLAAAAGMNGMIGGQVIDLESQGRKVDAATLDRIHRMKTGALMEAAAYLGALLGGGSEDEIERIAAFGRELGLAFQIVDDLLDVEGNPATLGKSAGKDLRAGKATYPSIHGTEPARHRANELADQAIALLTPLGPKAEPLAMLARRIVERSS